MSPTQLALPFETDHAWPITNVFNDPRTSYLYPPGQTGHEGIDWRCPTGTPIYAMTAGRVARIENDPQQYPYGNQVRVRTNWETTGGFEITYAHLAVVLVQLCDVVAAGDLIGISGNTGNSTGPHLHVHYKPWNFDARNGFGGAIDFHQWLAGPYTWPEPGQPFTTAILNALNNITSPDITAPTVRRTSEAAEPTLYTQPSTTAASPSDCALEADTSYAIVGKEQAEPNWWQIEVGRLKVCWVQDTAVDAGGQLEQVQVTWPMPEKYAWHVRKRSTEDCVKVHSTLPQISEDDCSEDDSNSVVEINQGTDSDLWYSVGELHFEENHPYPYVLWYQIWYPHPQRRSVPVRGWVSSTVTEVCTTLSAEASLYDAQPRLQVKAAADGRYPEVYAYAAPHAAAVVRGTLASDQIYTLVGKDNNKCIRDRKLGLSLPTPDWWQIAGPGSTTSWVRRRLDHLEELGALSEVPRVAVVPRVRWLFPE